MPARSTLRTFRHLLSILALALVLTSLALSSWRTEAQALRAVDSPSVRALDAVKGQIGQGGRSLTFSSYLGSSEGDFARGVAVDGAGNIYVVGYTGSANFPVFNAMQGTLGGAIDAFVSKISPDGSTFIYSTFLGGTSQDRAFGIAVDAQGNAYVTGWTGSTNFPVTAGVFQPAIAGGSDAFITKLSPTGALVYSTYLGGSPVDGHPGDSGLGIAVDGAGKVYVTGETAALDFPTRNAFQPDFGGGDSDLFIAQLNSTATELLYSTYLGGGGDNVNFESGEGIAVDPAGNMYVVGTTTVDDFPTVNAFQPEYAGGEGDAVVVKLNPLGVPIYSTFLGGDDTLGDFGYSIEADAEGNAYVAGLTSADDYPVVNAFQDEYGGSYDAYITKFNPTGSALVYSTYLGGPQAEGGFAHLGLDVDGAGQAYVSTTTESASFPLVNPVQATMRGNRDIFASQLSSSGSSLLFSTFLGGATGGFGQDDGYDVAVGPSGGIYLAGDTFTSDFPIANPLQGTFGGEVDGVVAMISGDTAGATPSPTSQATPTSTPGQPTATRTATPISPSATPGTVTTTPAASSPTAHASSTVTPPVVGTVAGTATASSTPTVCAVSFTDVPADSTFYSYVRCLACRGILGGYSDGTFRPNNNITRGQLSKIVSNAAGFSKPASGQRFEDVLPSNTFYVYVERMASRGIIGGYNCGGAGEPCGADNKPYFRPNADATRGQISKIVSNAAGFNEPVGGQRFEDVPPGSAFYEWIERLASRNIIGGYACGGAGEPCGAGDRPYFRPNANATRGQVSKIVSNALLACGE